MILSLKIEILKIFSLELNFSSDKGLTLKKDKQDEKEPVGTSPAKQPAASK